MLADNCWTLVRETPTEDYKRQKTIKCVSDVTVIYFWVGYCTCIQFSRFELYTAILKVL